MASQTSDEEGTAEALEDPQSNKGISDSGSGDKLAKFLIRELCKAGGKESLKSIISRNYQPLEIACIQTTTQLKNFLKQYSHCFILHEHEEDEIWSETTPLVSADQHYIRATCSKDLRSCDSLEVEATTDLKICEVHCTESASCTGGSECDGLHICKFFILSGKCMFGKGCKFGHWHNAWVEHNHQILKRHLMDHLEVQELRVLFRRPTARTSSTLPELCQFYNSYSGCNNGVNCKALHLCKRFLLLRECQSGEKCRYSHNFMDPVVLHILCQYGIEVEELPELMLDNKQGQPDAGYHTPKSTPFAHSQSLCRDKCFAIRSKGSQNHLQVRQPLQHSDVGNLYKTFENETVPLEKGNSSNTKECSPADAITTMNKVSTILENLFRHMQRLHSRSDLSPQRSGSLQPFHHKQEYRAETDDDPAKQQEEEQNEHPHEEGEISESDGEIGDTSSEDSSQDTDSGSRKTDWLQERSKSHSTLSSQEEREGIEGKVAVMENRLGSASTTSLLLQSCPDSGRRMPLSVDCRLAIPPCRGSFDTMLGSRSKPDEGNPKHFYQLGNKNSHPHHDDRGKDYSDQSGEKDCLQLQDNTIGGTDDMFFQSHHEYHNILGGKLSGKRSVSPGHPDDPYRYADAGSVSSTDSECMKIENFQKLSRFTKDQETGLLGMTSPHTPHHAVCEYSLDDVSPDEEHSASTLEDDSPGKLDKASQDDGFEDVSPDELDENFQDQKEQDFPSQKNLCSLPENMLRSSKNQLDLNEHRRGVCRGGEQRKEEHRTSDHNKDYFWENEHRREKRKRVVEIDQSETSLRLASKLPLQSNSEYHFQDHGENISRTASCQSKDRVGGRYAGRSQACDLHDANRIHHYEKRYGLPWKYHRDQVHFDKHKACDKQNSPAERLYDDCKDYDGNSGNSQYSTNNRQPSFKQVSKRDRFVRLDQLSSFNQRESAHSRVDNYVTRHSSVKEVDSQTWDCEEEYRQCLGPSDGEWSGGPEQSHNHDQHSWVEGREQKKMTCHAGSQHSASFKTESRNPCSCREREWRPDFLSFRKWKNGPRRQDSEVGRQSSAKYEQNKSLWDLDQHLTNKTFTKYEWIESDEDWCQQLTDRNSRDRHPVPKYKMTESHVFWEDSDRQLTDRDLKGRQARVKCEQSQSCEDREQENTFFDNKYIERSQVINKWTELHGSCDQETRRTVEHGHLPDINYFEDFAVGEGPNTFHHHLEQGGAATNNNGSGKSQAGFKTAGKIHPFRRFANYEQWQQYQTESQNSIGSSNNVDPSFQERKSGRFSVFSKRSQHSLSKERFTSEEKRQNPAQGPHDLITSSDENFQFHNRFCETYGYENEKHKGTVHRSSEQHRFRGKRSADKARDGRDKERTHRDDYHGRGGNNDNSMHTSVNDFLNQSQHCRPSSPLGMPVHPRRYDHHSHSDRRRDQDSRDVGMYHSWKRTWRCRSPGEYSRENQGSAKTLCMSTYYKS